MSATAKSAATRFRMMFQFHKTAVGRRSVLRADDRKIMSLITERFCSLKMQK